MENVVLVVHLILALSLIGIVLMQRSEGGMGSMGGVPLVAARVDVRRPRQWRRRHG